MAGELASFLATGLPSCYRVCNVSGSYEMVDGGLFYDVKERISRREKIDNVIFENL